MTGLRLDPRLDLRAAQGLAQGLLALRGQPLALDAGEVRHLGGLCLQVLASAAKTWRSDGHRLEISPRSAEFETALATFGLPLAALEAEGAA